MLYHYCGFMDLEWIAEDDSNTIGHASKMKLEGRNIISPLHMLTNRDLEIASRVDMAKDLNDTPVIMAGESLSYDNFIGVGNNSVTTDAIYKRIKAKIIPDKANLVHLRVPSHYELDNGNVYNVNRLNLLQITGLVGIQLEAGANVITPPIQQGISSIKTFETIYEGTKTEIQTYGKKEKEIVGYIPTTKELKVASDMIKIYLKDGVRFFAVDFSSSPLNRWLLRTVVSSIRSNLKIKGKIKENSDKAYYLHVFNVASSRKSVNAVSPITDILTPAYSVDSISGVMWGGGKLVKDKLRYFNLQDYGAYQVGSLDKNNISYQRKLTEGDASQVYDKLRTDKNLKYRQECKNISDTIGGNNGIAGYAPYLTSKIRATREVQNALIDVQEIKANSS